MTDDRKEEFAQQVQAAVGALAARLMDDVMKHVEAAARYESDPSVELEDFRINQLGILLNLGLDYTDTDDGGRGQIATQLSYYHDQNFVAKVGLARSEVNHLLEVEA